MKQKCQNHWYSLNSPKRMDADNTDYHSRPISELTIRIECEEVATTVIHDNYADIDKDVCERCREQIAASNWLHSPEGIAALEQLDWEEEDGSTI